MSLPIDMKWYFPGFKIIKFSQNQLFTVLKLDKSIWPISWISVHVANKLLSSAQLLKVLKQMKRNRSFMNKLKRSGPSIEPCGTPAITFFKLLNLLLI